MHRYTPETDSSMLNRNHWARLSPPQARDDDEQDGGGVAWLALVLGLCLLSLAAAGIVYWVMWAVEKLKGWLS